MNLINRENNTFEFLIETLDDLWTLSQFIVPDDTLEGKTERKVKIGTETNYKVVRKLIYIKLLTKSVKFENETLRITGEIQNETEFTSVGHSHTLSFSIGDKILITKKDILKFEEKLIKNACDTKNTHNLLILTDKDEMIISEFTNFNYKIFFHKKGLGNKKYIQTEIDEQEQKFFEIENYLKKDYSSILISGPGIYKEKLSKYIIDKTNKKILTFQWPDVNSNSVQKCINKINESGLILSSDLAIEQENISKLLENINKNKCYIYGYENTINKINEGSCETLIITTKLIDEKKEENKYQELNEYFKLVEQLNGKLVIINSKNEPGRILDGLGGIAGILRY